MTDPVTHHDDRRIRGQSGGRAAPSARRRLRRRLLSWRFWTLVALAAIDGLLFIIPVTAMGLIVCAVIAPDLLRRIARFLDALAAGA